MKVLMESGAHGGVTTGQVIELILWWVRDRVGPVATAGKEPENAG